MKNQIILFCVTVLLVSVSCKKETPYSLNKVVVSLVADATSQLSVDGGSGNFIYASDNPLIAEVNTEGLITAKRVGETKITVSGDFNGVCAVAVLPLFNIFKEPITTWGLSIDDIKAKESRILKTEIDGALLYTGSINENYVMYMFDSNNKLSSCGVIVSPQYTSALASFLIERYVIVSASPTLGYSPLMTFSFGAELQTNLDWWVLYFPYTLKSANLELSQKYKALLLNAKL
ncbi:MAG TPA: Ig-like domain-containing protein [Paludibacter sp.]